MCEIKSKIIKIEDFNFICRLCLNRDPTIRPILIKTDKDIKAGINENIVKRIFACTNIQVKNNILSIINRINIIKLGCFFKVYPNDGLPKYLCSTCLDKLNNCFLFRHQCLESDKILQKLIEKQDEEFMKSVCVTTKQSISGIAKEFESPNIPLNTDTVEVFQDKYDKNSDKDEDNNNNSDEDNKYKNTSESENNSINDSLSITSSDTEVKPKQKKRTKNKDELPEIKEQKRKRNKTKKIDVCPICGKITKSLSQHMHSHGKKKNKFKCEECEREFTQRDTYNDHMNTHTGNKPYKCTICAKEYHSSQSLRFHLAIHGDKKYDCDICNKTFSYSSSLRAHKQTHTQDRKHGCSYCEKMFLTR